jgi:hypothetical protein
VGVGWAEARLRRAYPRLRCGSPGGFRGCHLGRSRPGHRVTLFYIGRNTGRVRAVAVAQLGPHEPAAGQ